jgi:hypothetical protein
MEALDLTSTPPSTIVATPARLVACRRRHSKHIDNRKLVTTICSVDLKLVDYILEPLHARFDFIMEGCADEEGLNSHGDLPQCSPSDSVMARNLSGERWFFNPTSELAKQIGRYF